MADKRLQMPRAIAQVLIKYQLDGQPCENVLYVEHQHTTTHPIGYAPADFNADNADVVASRVKTWLQDEWADFAHVLASATEIDVIWNTVEGAGPLAGKVYQDSDFPIVGTNEGEPLPNNCTIAIEWRTALLGRSYHGRTYAVGLNDGHIDATAPNRLKASSLTDVPAVYEALRAAMGSYVESTLGVPDSINDELPMVVASFVHDGAIRTPATYQHIISTTISDPYLDSMRRRLPGHNRHGRRH